MELKDWIILFVPIVFGTIFTIVITNWNNKKINAKFAKKQIIKELLDLILKIRNTIHNLQFQLVDFESGLKDYYVFAGDLQIYVADHQDVLKQMTKIIDLDSINKLTNIIYESGVLKSNPNKVAEFGVKFKESEVTCDKIIKKFNNVLLEIN